MGEHPRIDAIVQGRERDGCYSITAHPDPIPGSPAEYVLPRMRAWATGAYTRAASAVKPNRAQFVDIETRGLSGDNQTWLASAAHLNSKGLVIEQFLARDPGEEQAVITAFLDTRERRPDWISFNGKAFDANRVARRAQAYGLALPAIDAHTDVCHVYRRHNKTRHLARVSLSELERTYFPKFKRQNHIAGKDIPEAYDRYVKGGDPSPVRDAIVHNAYDLVSLTAFYLMLLEQGF